MQNNCLKRLIAAALFMFTSSAFAQAAGSVGDLDRLQSATVLLKAQVKYEEEKSNLAKYQGGYGKTGGGLPVAKSILNGKVRFLYPNNIEVSAKSGDSIVGGYTVGKVNDDTVELIKGKERFMVGFANYAPNADANPGAQNAMYGGAPVGSFR